MTPQTSDPDLASDPDPDLKPDNQLRVRVWGARGSIATPSAGSLRYGGNTPCLEVNTACGYRVILDAGTGIRNLGMELLRASDSEPVRDYHIFLSHFHWDHLQGLPFFLPLYNPANTITFYSPHTTEHLQEVLQGQMATPYFPVGFNVLAAATKFVQVGQRPFQLGDVEITSFALTHPQGASGYRIECGGKAVVYATDHEHGVTEADDRLLHVAQGADLLFYDSQFTPEEYPSRKGWGHGTWKEAARVGAKAGVKKLVLFHHDPGHDDAQMDSIVTQAQADFPDTIAAMEGRTLKVA